MRIILAALALAFSNGFANVHSNNGPSRLTPLNQATVASAEDATTTTTCSTKVLANDVDFIKAQPDQRKYRAIRLDNGLECLLVSSPESDVEAGAVHVQAGHMDDPPNRPGLSHFNEHVLFLGNAKYPDENEYEGFLNQNGGSSNAYTDMEDTNYYFSVTSSASEDNDGKSTTSDALAGALDRLAQFFISPLFDANVVDREMRAIDSEYRNSFTSDAWRNFMLLKSSANPAHPFGKFGCGSYETLTEGGKIVNATHSEGIGSLPVEDLKTFWKTYYQTYNMRLSVVGRSSLDSLQKSVEETFGQIPFSEGAPRRSKVKADGGLFVKEHAMYDSPPAFGTEQLAKIRYLIPLVEQRVLKLNFASPPLNDPLLKISRPHRVISHLIGHEAPGSLHSLLNDEGLLTGLSSGVGVDVSDFSLFGVTLSLTPKGMEQKARVLSIVFQWIAMIRDALSDEGLMKAYHDEMRKIASMNFRYRENGDPTDFCSSAAELLFDTSEPAELLVGLSKSGEYDADVAEAFLERLSPENAMITVIAPDLDAEAPGSEWSTEKWYGAKYRDTNMTEEQIRGWKHPTDIDERLHLPALNEYIPTDFSLRCDGKVEESESKIESSDVSDDVVLPPKVLVERPNLRFWHKMDRKYRVPKTFIRVSLTSPNVYGSPRSMTLNRLYERVLNDDLNEYVYDAGMAGCNYRVACVPTGVRISLRGYSEKLPHLLDVLTSRMLTLIEELKEGEDRHPSLALKFKKARDNLLRQTKNYRLDTPYEIASYTSRLILEESVWYVDNYIRELEGEGSSLLTMQDCASAAEDCLTGRLRVEGIASGNINEKEALDVVDVIDKQFLNKARPLLDVEVPNFRSMKLPTIDEAKTIYGNDLANKKIPIVYQEVAFSGSEENNALELVLQAGCDFSMGYEGVAVLEMISHLAYNSAYSQLRTKEQLGYIVSAFTRKVSGGGWSLAVVVQSSVAPPSVLEERCEAWLAQFRRELEDMSLEDLEKEASAVVAQLLERDTRLSQEVSSSWGEISNTETLPKAMRVPAFDRVKKVAAQLDVSTSGSEKSTADLKQTMLDTFDKYFAEGSSERRAMSARIYNKKTRPEFEANVGKAGVLSNYDDIIQLKQFLPTYPIAPYWR